MATSNGGRIRPQVLAAFGAAGGISATFNAPFLLCGDPPGELREIDV